MPFIITLFIGLLLMGCGTEVPSIAKKTMPQPKSVTKPKLEGRYTLKKGIYSYSANSAINKNITASDLVIEKLDNDDYGYYFTMQVENLIPTQEYGIFHKQGDKYFKRILKEKKADFPVECFSSVSPSKIFVIFIFFSFLYISRSIFHML